MTNVLHTIETHGPGGAETILLTVASELKKDSFRSFGFFIKEGWISDKFKAMGIIPGMSRNRMNPDLILLASLIDYITRNKIDVMHAHEFTMGFYVALASRVSGIPSVVTLHGNKPYIQGTALRRWVVRFISETSSLVTVSNELKDWLMTRIGVHENKIQIIANGIDVDRFLCSDDDRISARRSLCAELGIKENCFLVVNVARLYGQKAHQYLIKAASGVLKKYPDVHFIVSGGGPDRGKLEGLISEEGIGSNFHLLGQRDDVAKILASGDIFALSSVWEGYSVSVLEAMATGLPIIATDVGDTSKIVDDGINGYLIPPKDATVLKEKIIQMIEGKSAREEFSRKSREMVARKHRKEKMVDEHATLYENIRKGR